MYLRLVDADSATHIYVYLEIVNKTGEGGGGERNRTNIYKDQSPVYTC